jgi:hypothetical protein
MLKQNASKYRKCGSLLKVEAKFIGYKRVASG